MVSPTLGLWLAEPLTAADWRGGPYHTPSHREERAERGLGHPSTSQPSHPRLHAEGFHSGPAGVRARADPRREGECSCELRGETLDQDSPSQSTGEDEGSHSGYSH